MRKNFLNNLLWMGSLALLTGLGLACIDLRFRILYLLLALLGLGLLGFVVFKVKQRVGKLSLVDSVKKSLAVIGAAVIFTTALVFINYLTCRYNFRWDVTAGKQHTLSDNTLKLIKTFSGDVQLTVFYVGFAPKYLEDLLKQYEKGSGGKIVTRIIDPIQDIGYAAQFGAVISGKESKLIVQSQKERKDVDFTQEPLNEEMINNAIIRVTRKPRNVYFLTGHGEYSLSQEGAQGLSKLAKLLSDNNILTADLLLGPKGIPADCDLLIIAGAQKRFNEDEEKAITAYLEKGGDALILIENVIVTTPDKPLSPEDMARNPSLNNILKNWGIKVLDDVVVDLASHASGDVGSPATRNYFAQKSITRDLDYTFYVRPRSIAMVPDRRKTLNLLPLVMTSTSENSWGESNRTLEVKLDKDDRPGPVPIAFIIAEQKGENDSSDTRIGVFTDADFLSNAYIDFYSNAQMGFHVIQWVTEVDYQAMNAPKNFEFAMLNLTSQQKRAVLAVLAAMPFFILIAGAGVWLKGHE